MFRDKILLLLRYCPQFTPPINRGSSCGREINNNTELSPLYQELAENLADMLSEKQAKMIDEIEDNENWAEYPFDGYGCPKD